MSNASPWAQQSGAALIVALILLVIMTLLGLSSVRTVALEERMTANTYDRSLAFQAAEAGLRAGEIVAQAQANSGNAGFNNGGLYSDTDATCPDPASASPCQNGLCSIPDKDCPVRWEIPDPGVWEDATGLGLGALATTPQYIVEFLGANFPCRIEDPSTMGCKRYRVTSRSNDGTEGRAMVILQSVYAAD